jgi:hypothetical protein
MKDPLRLRFWASVFAVIGALLLLPVFCQARVTPEVVHCRDPLTEAFRYSRQAGVQTVLVQSGTGPSMSNLWPSGTWYVVEQHPYDAALGHAAAFVNPSGGTTVHFLVARRKGGYLSKGDSPTNPRIDPWRVSPAQYRGVVRKVFTLADK